MADTVGKALEVVDAIPVGVWGFLGFCVLLALAVWIKNGGEW